MSDTPRTDAHCQTIWSNDPHCPGPVSTVSASFARELERELNALRASQSEAVQRDAARWRFAVKHGMPVRNQTAHAEGVRWLAFSPQGMRAGKEPVDAIDAAMRAGCDAPEERPKGDEQP